MQFNVMHSYASANDSPSLASPHAGHALATPPSLHLRSSQRFNVDVFNAPQTTPPSTYAPPFNFHPFNYASAASLHERQLLTPSPLNLDLVDPPYPSHPFIDLSRTPSPIKHHERPVSAHAPHTNAPFTPTNPPLDLASGLTYSPPSQSPYVYGFEHLQAMTPVPDDQLLTPYSSQMKELATPSPYTSQLALPRTPSPRSYSPSSTAYESSPAPTLYSPYPQPVYHQKQRAPTPSPSRSAVAHRRTRDRTPLEKTLKCPHNCGLLFARMHDLRRHTTIHTGETPFICHGCDTGFKRSDARQRHWNKMPECLIDHDSQLTPDERASRRRQKRERSSSKHVSNKKPVPAKAHRQPRPQASIQRSFITIFPTTQKIIAHPTSTPPADYYPLPPSPPMEDDLSWALNF